MSRGRLALTPHGGLLTGVAVGLAALAGLTGTLWFTVLCTGVAGLLVGAFVVPPRVQGLTFCCRGPVRVAVGDDVTHHLHVHNRGDRSTGSLALTFRLRGVDDVRVHVDPLPPGGRATFDLVRTVRSRGVAEQGELLVRATGPLGLVVAAVGGVLAQRLVVHPAPVTPDRAIARGEDDSGSPTTGQGTDVAGVREWRAGDDHRRVHWRSTARRGELVVIERGYAPARRLVLAVVGPAGGPDWEAAIAVAAATAREAQGAGRPVSVISFRTGSVSPTVAPEGSVTALLDWWAALAQVDPPAPEDLVRAVGSMRGAEPVVVACGPGAHDWFESARRVAATAGLDLSRLGVPR